jgi:signal transduction histidine kinase
MSRLRVSVGVALAVCVFAPLGLAAGAAAAGYLVETHHQDADRDHRLAAAAVYVEHGATRAETKPWQQALTEKLAALRLSAQLALVSPTSKRSIYQPRPIAGESKVQASAGQSTGGRPTATYVYPLARGSRQRLRLDLFAAPLDRNRRLLVALVCGLAALLVGTVLLLWAARRWLVAPLRRLSAQVDAIAGGDRIDTRASSPIREVGNVATAVAGMAGRLAQTAEQDARVDAERRLLVSSIAHDLRTPLFSLRGYLDAIANGIGNPRQRLDRAREKAHQIDRLVTGLFDYARAEIDERPRLQRTDLAEAVTTATTGFELAADQRGVELRVAGQTGSQVTIDRDGFDRALANVLDNALRHTPHGRAITITCGEDTDGAFVEVLDDGPGIAADLLPHIFEPMVRANSNGHTGGTGLGLSIAARLLQHQGGTIHAANAPGHGAVLTLRIPRASTRPAQRE